MKLPFPNAVIMFICVNLNIGQQRSLFAFFHPAENKVSHRLNLHEPGTAAVSEDDELIFAGRFHS
jgi:hypothetical protein